VSDLQALVEREDADPEMIPSIVPVDSRLSIGMITSEFLSMVSRIAALVPSKEVVPGTSMMLIEAISSGDTVPHVRISASDGDQWMQVVSTGQLRVFMPGAVVVPAKKILEALKLAPASVTKFSVVGSEARLLSGRAQWTFATPISDRLTVTPVQEDVETTEVPAESLRSALKAVVVATNTSTARSAFLQAHVAHAEVTATDGARLHRQVIPGLDPTIAVDIPVKIIARVLDLLSGLQPETMIRFGANERRIHFHIEDARIIAQRILLPFPDIESIMIGVGMMNEKSFTVRTDELKAAVKRVRVNSDPDYSTLYLGVRIMVDGKWGLSLRGRDSNGNEAQEIVDVQWTGTKPREFAVNHHFLTDVLNQVPSDYTIVRVGDDTKTQKSPLFIEDSGFRAVLSQMRMDWIG
jgi:DNA polymerase III sliding clamp (beta) subunit (PCNA family)